MQKTVDAFRFISGITRRMIKNWISQEMPRPIPWTPLRRPLSECTVTLLSSAGIALKTDKPFDQEGERQNPWWGDPSYRVLPKAATEEDVRIYHLHIDPSYAGQDLNCLFPLPALADPGRYRAHRPDGAPPLFDHGLHPQPGAASAGNRPGADP